MIYGGLMVLYDVVLINAKIINIFNPLWISD
mgnify:CR=1 FL=1